MSPGKIFEKNIKDSVNIEDTYFYRLKDPATSFDQNKDKNSPIRFSYSNDYDFILFKKNYYALELKSTIGTSISIGGDLKDRPSWKGKAIKLNQVKGLAKVCKYDGAYGGFLFNFRKVEKTYWMNIIDFLKFHMTTTKKSINMQDVINHNGILIDQRKKIKHYKYDIDKMLKDVSNS